MKQGTVSKSSIIFNVLGRKCSEKFWIAVKILHEKKKVSEADNGDFKNDFYNIFSNHNFIA